MIKPEDLRKMTPGQRASLKKAELAARLKAQMKKPGRSTPGVKVPGKPAPLATPRPRTYPGGGKPAPMPKRVPNLSLPPDQRTKAKPMPSGPKVKTPTPAKPKPKAKKPTLNDYLKQGKRPPIAPGQKKLPSDADVIIKGYNDKKTINKYKKGK
jgi:hypothetical protein